MEKRMILAISILFMLSILIISGCSSNNEPSYQSNNTNPAYEKGDGAARNNQFGTGRKNNLTQEERQQMIEARMQLAKTACQDKTEGDACAIQGQRGEINGTCKNQNGVLMCTGANNWQGSMRANRPINN